MSEDFGDFVCDAKSAKIDERKALRDPEMTAQIFGFRVVHVSKSRIEIIININYFVKF